MNAMESNWKLFVSNSFLLCFQEPKFDDLREKLSSAIWISPAFQALFGELTKPTVGPECQLAIVIVKPIDISTLLLELLVINVQFLQQPFLDVVHTSMMVGYLPLLQAF